MAAPRSWWPPLIAAVVAISSAALLLEAARGDSVTIDEFAHLPAGLYYLHTGRFNLYNLSPPLLRVWCALPVWWAGAGADFAAFVAQPNHWLLGYDFMNRNAAQYQQLFVMARVPTIVLVLGLIVTLFVAGRHAFGAGGGVAAATLGAFCPNILAHGHLVTTDLGHAWLFLLAVLAYERALRRPSRGAVMLAGIILGLAELTKFTALLLYPLVGVITLVALGASTERAKTAGAFATAVTISLVVLNAGYLFEGCGASLSSYDLQTSVLRGLAAGPLGSLPLPLPGDFVRGYDGQLLEAQGKYTVFFHGQLARTGWWYYNVAAIGLKTSTALLALAALGTVAWVAGGQLRRQPLRSAVLLLPPLLYVTLFSWYTDINLGVRYMLPMYPFLFLIAASLWSSPWTRGRVTQALLAAVLAAHVGSALLSRPFYLAYFNAAAGGSEHGYQWLVDSNVDWGQELLRLKGYLLQHRLGPVRMAYFGRVAPEVYGIDYELIRDPVTPGVYVVSASYLMGRPYYLYDHGSLYWAPQNLFAAFQQRTPTAVIGHSLFVFDLRDSSGSAG